MTWRHDDLTMFVYALLDDDGRAVYVGITCNPKQRRRVHLITAAQAYRGDTPLKRWLLARKARGLGVPMLLLEKVHGVKAARRRELHWIRFYEHAGRDLLNTLGKPRQRGLFG